jgi:asparagine synthase (glutamine-hydrolysing)
VPIRIWLRDEKYYEIVKKAFNGEAANKYFNTDEIMGFLDEHKAGNADNSRKIWTIYMFLVWYEEYFGKNADKHIHEAA